VVKGGGGCGGGARAAAGGAPLPGGRGEAGARETNPGARIMCALSARHGNQAPEEGASPAAGCGGFEPRRGQTRHSRARRRPAAPPRAPRRPPHSPHTPAMADPPTAADAAHGLRRRAPVDYSLTRADFGGTPAWLKSTSAAGAGSPERGGKENGAGAARAPHAAPAAAPKPATKPRVAHKSHKAGGKAGADAAKPRAPKRAHHGLAQSRAALVAPAPAGGRGSAPSTSAHSSDRARARGGGGKRAKGARSPPRGGSFSAGYGSPTDDGRYDDYGGAASVGAAAWGALSPPHRARAAPAVRFAPAADAEAGDAAADALRRLQARGAGRDGAAWVVPGGGPLENGRPPPPLTPLSTSSPSSRTSTAASRSRASTRWRSCCRSTTARWGRGEEEEGGGACARVAFRRRPPTLFSQVEESVAAATRLADHWRAEAERQAATAAGAAAARDELRSAHADLAAARGAALDAQDAVLDARAEAADLRRALAAAHRRAQKPDAVDAGVQACLLDDGGGGVARLDPGGDARRHLAAAWCPEGGDASSQLCLPRAAAPAAHAAVPGGALRLPTYAAAVARDAAGPGSALPPPPFAAAADAGFTASPRADGAVVYTHAASGLRLALASRRDGAGGLEHVVSVLDAGDVSLPAYLDASELAAAPGPDWRMLMSKLVVVVGGRDKRAAAGMGRAW